MAGERRYSASSGPIVVIRGLLKERRWKRRGWGKEGQGKMKGK